MKVHLICFFWIFFWVYETSHCRRIILDELTATTNLNVALLQINTTKLSDGAQVDIDLVFFQKISNFYINVKFLEHIRSNDSVVKVFEKKLSVCRSGFKHTNDLVYKFLHNAAEHFSNIPSCPVPAGKYYIKNFVFDSKIFFGISSDSEKSFTYLGDYCFKEKVEGVDPCFVKAVVKLRLKN